MQHWERVGGSAPNRSRQAVVAAVLGMSPAEPMHGVPPAPVDLTPRALRIARMFDDLAHDPRAQKMIVTVITAMLNTPDDSDQCDSDVLSRKVSKFG